MRAQGNALSDIEQQNFIAAAADTVEQVAEPERNGFTVSSAIGNWLTSSISPAAEPKETVPLQSLFKKTSWTDETKSVPAVFVGDGNTVTISKLPDRSISKISIAASRYPSESQGNVAQGSVSSASNLYTAASQLESNISRKIIRKKPVPLETNVNTADSAMGGFLMCSTPNMSAQLESSFDLFSKTIGEVELLDECASLDSRRSSRLERGSDVSSRPSVKSLARAEPLAADEYVDAYTKSIDPEWDVIEVLPRNDGASRVKPLLVIK
ncbi:hypothetical protein BC829DRAFT_443798 [Chytridium lagenaria]|nr:hypothetical protein BC829DRAFT_443798 [Chytridium lagenaria]